MNDIIQWGFSHICPKAYMNDVEANTDNFAPEIYDVESTGYALPA